jgi:hypothetical protein
MKIKILNYEIDLEILILIGIIYLILVLNTCYSCCNVRKITETMKNMENMKFSVVKK